jgi:phosphoribosylglycinamide formyltransferase 1
MPNQVTNIAIFASGSGSNALAIWKYFERYSDKKIALIVTNKRDAGVLQHAQKHQIPAVFITNDQFSDKNTVLELLANAQINTIALAGFLRLIPTWLIDAYPQRILNIHPALLPKYGGKGMYGQHIHNAVKAAQETETGVTIHLVNAEYDKGAPLFQMKCTIHHTDTEQDIAARVLQLEHQFYPRVLAAYIDRINNI